MEAFLDSQKMQVFFKNDCAYLEEQVATGFHPEDRHFLQRSFYTLKDIQKRCSARL